MQVVRVKGEARGDLQAHEREALGREAICRTVGEHVSFEALLTQACCSHSILLKGTAGSPLDTLESGVREVA
jgi:hypothetical protein